MKIYLGTDHAGFPLKETIKSYLLGKGYDVVDYGAFTFNADDDYPDFISQVGQAVAKNPLDRGIVLGGSGQAEAMLANKYKGVRCALFYAPIMPVGVADAAGRISDDPFEMLRLTREHNNANVLSLGARFLTNADACKAVLLWLETPFPADTRHVRRIGKMTRIEEKVFCL